jgi:hypothetical protein
VSNTSGAAGEEEEVCPSFIELILGKSVRERTGSRGSPTFYKGTISDLCLKVETRLSQRSFRLLPEPEPSQSYACKSDRSHRRQNPYRRHVGKFHGMLDNMAQTRRNPIKRCCNSPPDIII